MKKIFRFATASLLFATVLLASCSKQDDPAAAPSGDARDKFLANWSETENSHDFGSSSHPCTVSDSSDATHILFAYLYSFTRKTYATVSGNNISIPSQTISGLTISGSGALTNANRIDMSYLVRTSTTHWDTVTAVFLK